MRERFDAKWLVTLGGCHEWQGARDRAGYGKFSVGGRQGTMRRAHVVSWFLANGSWPSTGEVVRHSCDNPPCVNPGHLLLGTKIENEQDKVMRGRHHSQKKDACRNGHPYAEHGSVNQRGRYCLTCVREQKLAYYHRTGASIRLTRHVPTAPDLSKFTGRVPVLTP